MPIRTGSVFWVILMFVVAGLQFNDPDPVPWVAVYGACGMTWLLRALHREVVFLEMALLGVLIFWMGALSHGVMGLIEVGSIGDMFASMSDDTPYVELAREFFGLAMTAIGLSCVLFYTR